MNGTNQQFIWGSTRIINIEHTPYHKILKALRLVYEALRGKLNFAYGKFVVYRDDNGKVIPPLVDKTASILSKKNCLKLQKALYLLQREGYVDYSILRSEGTLVVYWFTGHIDLDIFKYTERLHEKHDLSVFNEPMQRTGKQIAKQERSDHTAIKQPWCDGKPQPKRVEYGISDKDYEYKRLLLIKLASLPKNYME